MSNRFEVPEPIICSADDEPAFHWHLEEGRGSPVVHPILETRGFDELAEVKAAAAERWIAAVNAEGRSGAWRYAMARKLPDVRSVLDAITSS